MRLLPRPTSAYSASLTSLFLLLLSTPQLAAAASAVLGIDLGQEFIKAALVKPGIPLEIVLTKDTKRKETSAVGFKPAKSDAPGFVFPERLYGADAANLAARFPGDVYPNLKQLLGKHIIDDDVQEYSARYPALLIHPNKIRPSVLFHSASSTPGPDGDRAFAVEELLAMQLRSIKRSAEAMAGPGSEGLIKNVVFTIPAFFNAEERYALQLAAELAGLKVMNIISDGLAVAVNYATSREFPSDKEAEYHIIYDMGAGSTTATLVKFSGKKVKDYGTRMKDVTEVAVLGVGWDEGLGGDLFNKKLSKLLLDDFIESQAVKRKFTDPDVNAKNVVRLNGKSAAKLWREATKVRHILSANTETSASVESLYEDVDFRSSKITRAEFEALIAEYADRMTAPIDQAIKAAGLNLEDIRSLIVHGGGARVPFVGKLLEGLVGEGKISRTVNSDEAAVMGATFRGAALSNSFKVRDIYVKDANVYPVNAKVKASGADDITKHDIFPAFTNLATTHVLPLKLSSDFDVVLSHVLKSKPLQEEPVVMVSTKNLTATAEQLFKDFGCTSEHIRTELTVRLSDKTGLPEITEAVAGCDVEYEDVPEVVETKKEAETGKEKGGIVDDVKGFFGLNKKKDQAADTTEKVAEANPTPAADASSGSEDTIVFNVQEGEAPNLYPGAAKKYITKFEKIPVEIDSAKAGFPQVPADELKILTEKLDSYDNYDKEIIIRDTHFNTLEALIYKVRDYLGQDPSDFLTALEPSLHGTLQSLMDHLQEWLYDGGESASSKILEEKLDELNKIVEPARRRMEESVGREAKVKRLRDALNQAGEIGKVMDETLKLEESVRQAKEAKAEADKKAAEEAKKDGLEEETEEKPATATPAVDEDLPPASVYSAADYTALKELLSTTEKWLEEELVKQEPLLPHQDPTLSVASLDKKIGEVNQAVMNILQRGMKRQEERDRLQKEKEKEREKKEKREKREKEKREKEERKKRRDEEKKAKDEKREGRRGDQTGGNSGRPEVRREEIHEEL